MTDTLALAKENKGLRLLAWMGLGALLANIYLEIERYVFNLALAARSPAYGLGYYTLNWGNIATSFVLCLVVTWIVQLMLRSERALVIGSVVCLVALIFQQVNGEGLWVRHPDVVHVLLGAKGMLFLPLAFGLPCVWVARRLEKRAQA